MTFSKRNDWRFRGLISNIPLEQKEFVTKWWERLCEEEDKIN